jgi:hypothetical protein
MKVGKKDWLERFKERHPVMAMALELSLSALALFAMYAIFHLMVTI